MGLDLSRKVVVPLATVGALLVAGGAFLGAEAATGSGAFHASVSPAGATTGAPVTDATPAVDTPSASPSTVPAGQDTQAVTTPTGDQATAPDPAGSTSTPASDPGAAAPAPDSSADTPAAASPITGQQTWAPGTAGGQVPPTVAPTRPPAPQCPANSQAVWMGDSWVCTAPS